MSTLPPADSTRDTAPPAERPTTTLPPAAPAAQGVETAHQQYAGAPYAYPAQHTPEYAARPAQKTTLADTNTYALVSVILTFIVPLAGIIFGHLGLNQIKRTGDAGRGLALTGLIYGYCMLVLGTLFIVLYIGFFAVLIGAAASGDAYTL